MKVFSNSGLRRLKQLIRYMIHKEVATICDDSPASTRHQAWQSSRTALQTAAARSEFRAWSTKLASDTLRTGGRARTVTRTTSRTSCAGLPSSTRLVTSTWTTGAVKQKHQFLTDSACSAPEMINLMNRDCVNTRSDLKLSQTDLLDSQKKAESRL